MSTPTIDEVVNSIYADTLVAPAEIIRLRKAVDAAEDQIVAALGGHGIVATLFKSFDVTRQLMQDSVLEVRKGEGKYSNDLKAQIYAAIEANVKLLQANLDAFAK